MSGLFVVVLMAIDFGHCMCVIYAVDSEDIYLYPEYGSYTTW